MTRSCDVNDVCIDQMQKKSNKRKTFNYSAEHRDLNLWKNLYPVFLLSDIL